MRMPPQRFNLKVVKASSKLEVLKPLACQPLAQEPARCPNSLAVSSMCSSGISAKSSDLTGFFTLTFAGFSQNIPVWVKLEL